MNNFSIRTKLLCGFGIILVLLLGVGIAGIYCISLVNQYSSRVDAQKDTKSDAEIVNGVVYQARMSIMRGIYAKDIRTKSDSEKDINKTYWDFLDGNMKVLGKDLNEPIERIKGRLDPANPQAAEDIQSCEKIKQFFHEYDDKTTGWAKLQDQILDSTDERMTLAEALKDTVGKIIAKTDENIDKEGQSVEINGKSEPYTHKRLAVRQKQLGDILESFEVCRRLVQMQISISDNKEFLAFNEQVKTEVEKTRKEITDVISELQTPENVENAKKVLEYLDKWVTNVGKISAMITQQQSLFEEFGSVAQKMVAQTKTLVDHADQATTEASKGMEVTISLANRIIFGTIILAVLIGIVMGLVLTKNITGGINNAANLMNAIAKEGDISQEIPGEFLARGDEIGTMTKSINGILQIFKNVETLAQNLASGNWRTNVQIRSDKDLMNINIASMLDQINEVLSEIQGNVTQVSTGANEVSSASQNLSNGAQESAASLEEISASMQEISSQTQGNATSASEAKNLADSATKATVNGQTAMKEMITVMERITNNSHEIQRVIKVIDDIAFQTNLLALNAAVEAARAGVHGKGFAVVAEEVRNLAARSSKAAQETTELISKSSNEIQNGGTAAKQTADALNAIVEQIEKTAQIIAEIAVASNQQAEGVKQVSLGLQQIDTVTQQNSAAAEESASASNEMSSMAKNLQGLVGKFQLRQGSAKRHETTSKFQGGENESRVSEYELAETV